MTTPRARASGLTRAPAWSSASITAPAPHRSSSPGRRDPSGQRSPAGTKATIAPSTIHRASHRATGVRLRKRRADDRRTRVPPSAAQMDEPLGEGSTSRSTGADDMSCAAARVTAAGRRAARASNRPTASTASLLSGERRRALVLPREGVDPGPARDRDAERRGEGQHVDDHRDVRPTGDRGTACRAPVEPHVVRRLAVRGLETAMPPMRATLPSLGLLPAPTWWEPSAGETVVHRRRRGGWRSAPGRRRVTLHEPALRPHRP